MPTYRSTGTFHATSRRDQRERPRDRADHQRRRLCDLRRDLEVHDRIRIAFRLLWRAAWLGLQRRTLAIAGGTSCVVLAVKVPSRHGVAIAALFAAIAAGSGCAGPRATQLLTFPADDGVAVNAYGYGRAASHGVVLVPGGHGVGETWEPQARQLARAGFRVLALDYRGLGRSSDGPQDEENVYRDVLAAVRRLRTEGAAEVSVVGASAGGSWAGQAALVAPGEIDRLVFLASAPDRPEDLGGRKLYIVADNDRDGSGRIRLDDIHVSFERTPHPKQLAVVDGAAHAQFLFLTPQGDRVMDEIERFLAAD